MSNRKGTQRFNDLLGNIQNDIKKERIPKAKEETNLKSKESESPKSEDASVNKPAVSSQKTKSKKIEEKEAITFFEKLGVEKKIKKSSHSYYIKTENHNRLANFAEQLEVKPSELLDKILDKIFDDAGV